MSTYAESYATKMRADHLALMEERAWTGTARWNNPSALGHPCDRYLVLRRTKGHLQHRPSPSLQARFEMGKEIGRLAVRYLLDRGWDIQSIEGPVEWAEYQISGRPDIKVRPPGNGRGPHLPVEVKSVHPGLMAGVGTLADILAHRNWRVRTWPSQLMTYELLDGQEEGILLPISLTGGWEPIAVPLDYEHGEALLRQAERVNAHIAEGSEPEVINDPDVCPSCPFYMTDACSPQMAFSPDIGVVADEEVSSGIHRLLELEAAHREYGQLADRLKPRFKGETGEDEAAGTKRQWLVPDEAMVQATLRERTEKPRPESRTIRYWQVDFLPLKAEEETDAD